TRFISQTGSPIWIGCSQSPKRSIPQCFACRFWPWLSVRARSTQKWGRPEPVIGSREGVDRRPRSSGTCPPVAATQRRVQETLYCTVAGVPSPVAGSEVGRSLSKGDRLEAFDERRPAWSDARIGFLD